jgi:hypothetical protein
LVEFDGRHGVGFVVLSAHVHDTRLPHATDSVDLLDLTRISSKHTHFLVELKFLPHTLRKVQFR